METTVKKVGTPMGRVLVHMCCGPCAVIPLKTLLNGRFEVWGFFHNPNIHPYSEFLKRLSAVKTLASHLEVDLICNEEYRPMEFIREMRESLPEMAPKHPPKGQRCSFCYSTRLEETAKAAAMNGFDAFSSSLLYSKYQDHDEIKKLGAKLAEKYSVRFYYEDFRVGWQEGFDRSREIGLYMQKYCGCVYSKIERYAGKKKAKPSNI
jgi:epoxyqueuosine reductase